MGSIRHRQSAIALLLAGVALTLSAGQACAQATIELPSLPAPAWPRSVLPSPSALVSAPHAADWPRPEFTRPLAAAGEELTGREQEAFLCARNLIAAGDGPAGERLLRALARSDRPEVRTAAWLELAGAAEESRRGEEALAALDSALVHGAGDDEAWRLHARRAWLMAGLGRTSEAVRLLAAPQAQAPAGDRRRAELGHWAGWLAAGAGDLAAARAAWSRALPDASAHPALADSIHLALAQVAIAAGSWPAALADLRAAASSPQCPPLARFLFGRALFETGRADSAEIVLQSLPAPGSALPAAWLDEARVILGWIALGRGDTQRAREIYAGIGAAGGAGALPSHYGTALALIAEQRAPQAESLLVAHAPADPAHPLFYPWAYALAHARFAQERYAEAIESLESFRGHVSADSLSRAAWSLRGDSHYRLGQAEEAYAAYTKAAALMPEPPEFLLRRQAVAALGAGEWGAAARHLGDLILRFPQTLQAAEYHFWRAEAFYRLERRPEARRHYRRALALGADIAACCYALGWCDYEERRYADALVNFDRALAHCRGCAFAGDLLLRRGNCLFNLGRVAEAEQSFARAAAQASSDSLADLGGEATFRRGWSLLRMEDFDGARAAFEEIRRREGDSAAGATALYWAAVSCFRQELYDQAVPLLRELLALDGAPDSLRARALLGLGDSHFNMGDQRGAVEWYRRILEAPGAAREVMRTAHESLFECRVALNQWAEADSVLADLEQRFPEAEGLADRHLQVAEGYLRERRYPSALEAYGDFLERATPQDPRLLTVRFRMARCREELGERETAAAAYEALGEHEDFRDRSEALLRAGALRLELDQPREALRPLEKRMALELDPAQTALTRAYLAESYQKLGERQAARAEWEKVADAGQAASDSLRAVANLRLGRMAFEGREWQAAFQCFAAAESLGADAAIYRSSYWAGEAAYRAGDTTRAVVWLESFLSRPEAEALWEATARLRLAGCYEGRGRMREARGQYEAVLALPLSETSVQSEARRRLQELGRSPRERGR